MTLPDLSGWEPTRDSLALYVRIPGAVRRALATPHPRWWHVSLRRDERGLTTGPVPLEEGRGDLELRLDLVAHRLSVEGPDGETRHLSLADAPSARDLGRRTLDVLERLGVGGEIDEERFADDGERRYDPAAAERYRDALARVAEAFVEVRSGLPASGGGELGPMQLWPHHFDFAWEWFAAPPLTAAPARASAVDASAGEPTAGGGAGEAATEEAHGGEEADAEEGPPQIGFGFAPGDESHREPYFYANPWPFDEAWREVELPEPARWNVEGWQGALLPYAAVRRRGPELLVEVHRRVWEKAAPRLRAR